MTLDTKQTTERVIAVGALVVVALGPVIFNDYWVDAILTQVFIVGIAAASLIFLAAYGGMISLAQTALMGSAGFMIGNMVTVGGGGGESKGLTLGWDPTLSLVLALVGTTLLGMIFGAVASRSFGIYFLMITLTFSVITLLLRRPGDGRLGLLRASAASTATRPASSATSSPTATACTTSRSVSRSSSTASSATSCARRSASRSRGSGTSTCG